MIFLEIRYHRHIPQIFREGFERRREGSLVSGDRHAPLGMYGFEMSRELYASIEKVLTGPVGVHDCVPSNTGLTLVSGTV